jgi:hypothetical protein
MSNLTPKWVFSSFIVISNALSFFVGYMTCAFTATSPALPPLAPTKVNMHCQQYLPLLEAMEPDLLKADDCHIVWAFGNTYDSKMGFVVPSNKAGEYCLMDTASPRKIGNAYVDANTGGVVIDLGSVRVGVMKQ